MVDEQCRLARVRDLLEPAAGSSRQSSLGSAASALATPTSFRSPWARSDGRASSLASRPSSFSDRSTAGVEPTGRDSTSRTVAHTDGR